MITMRNSDTKIDFGSRRAQHLLVITDRFDADRDQRSLDRYDAGTELHFHSVGIIGHCHWPGEPNEIRGDPAGISYPVRHHPKRRSHGEHAMGNDTRQPDLSGEVLRVVDRIEVRRSAGVPD